ncbi:MAG: EthD family reductase [Pseudomonadota bacterium]|uniref:EthD family reductase n=1 Tax=Limnobacter alexandrii TaxID=2570352 RepID=UPI0011086819|nr:EthD family reductase [Limnobacter alexandrii]
MIKVSVMYPNAQGVSFDHEYYKTTHMPLVKSKMGKALHHYTVDKGLAGGAGDAPAFVAMGHLLVDSVEAFQAAFGPHAQEIMGDIPNYTNASPVIVISEVTVEKG